MSMKTPKIPAAPRPPNPGMAPSGSGAGGRSPMFSAFRNATMGAMGMMSQRNGGRPSLIGATSRTMIGG